MTGYSTSVRFEMHQRADLDGLVRHEGRSVDPAQLAHSNEMIVASKTGENLVWVNDGQGGVRPCHDYREWLDYADARLATVQNTRTLKDGRTVPVARRKDAIEVADCVFMLDPEFTGRCEDMTAEQKDEAVQLLEVMAQTMTDRMGAENVVGYAVHFDETHPHMHMVVTPVTDEGKLRWKSFVNGKQDLSKFHDQFRHDLREAGYDATMERIDGGRRGVPLQEFKALRDRERELRETQDHLTLGKEVVEAQQDRLEELVFYAQEERAELPRLRRQAQERGYRHGQAEAREEAEELLEAAKVEAQRITREAMDRMTEALATQRRADEREAALKAKEEALEAEWEKARVAVALTEQVTEQAVEVAGIFERAAAAAQGDERLLMQRRSRAATDRAASLRQAAKPLSQLIAEREASEGGRPGAGAPGLRSELG